MIVGCSSHFISDEAYREKVEQDFANREAIMQASGIKLAEMELAKYTYGDGEKTLKDFFVSLAYEDDERVLYPLVSVLTDGEFSALSYGCFLELALGINVNVSSYDQYDEKYEELAARGFGDRSAPEVLLYLNRELFSMIENRIDISLLSRLLSTQLTVSGGKQLLDRNRVYFKLLRRIVGAGQERGEITGALSADEIVRLYAMTERGLLYDWCLRGGDYSLADWGARTLPLLVRSFEK